MHFADMWGELVFEHEFTTDLAGLVFVNGVGIAVLVEQVFFDIGPLNRGFAKGAFKIWLRGLCHIGLSERKLESKQFNRFWRGYLLCIMESCSGWEHGRACSLCRRA